MDSKINHSNESFEDVVIPDEDPNDYVVLAGPQDYNSGLDALKQRQEYLDSKNGIVKEVVLIINENSLLTAYLERRVRELNVEAICMQGESIDDITKVDCKAIIISSGFDLKSFYRPTYYPTVFKMGVPVLAIGNAMMFMNLAFGGSVTKATERDSKEPIEITCRNSLFKKVLNFQDLVLFQGVKIDFIASDFKITALCQNVPVAISSIDNDKKLKLHGVQFFPRKNVENFDILSSFLLDIAEFKGTFTLEKRIADCLSLNKEKVGKKKVLMLASGGLHSTLSTVLLSEALPKDQLIVVYIDNGLMRDNEEYNFRKELEKLEINLVTKNVEDYFLNNYSNLILDFKNISVTEETGCKYRVVKEKIMKTIEDLLTEYELAPNDLCIVSSRNKDGLKGMGFNFEADKEKQDFWIQGLLERYVGLILINPLSEFHKDELRTMAKGFSLSKELTNKHPFTLLGFSRRIFSSGLEPPFADELKEVEKILFKYIRGEKFLNCFMPAKIKAELNKFQYFLMALESTVANKFKEETFRGKYFLAISGISGENTWAYIRSITNHIERYTPITRVCYVLKSCKELKIGYSKLSVNGFAINTVRKADSIITKILKKHNSMHKFSEFPVTLIPVYFDTCNKNSSFTMSVVLRPVCAPKYNYRRPAVPGKDFSFEVLNEIIEVLGKELKYCNILYDCTPVAVDNIEWECINTN